MRTAIKASTFVQDARGRVFLNENTNYVKGGVLLPVSEAATIAARSGTSLGAGTPSIFETPTDSWGEILSLWQINDSTADIRDRLLVTPSLYRGGLMTLCNRPVAAQHVFGTTQNPMYLDNDFAKSLVLPPQQVLLFNFLNGSTSGSNAINIAAGYTKVQNKALQRVKKEVDAAYAESAQIFPYWLTMEQSVSSYDGAGATIAFGAQANVQFINRNPYSLIITSIMGHAVNAGSGDSETFTVELFDQNYDAPYQDQPISMNCGAGLATFPYRLRAPIYVEPMQRVRGVLTSLNTSGNMDVFVTLFGVAVMRDGLERALPDGRLQGKNNIVVVTA